MDLYTLTIPRGEVEAHGCGFPHHATDLGVAVFEREIMVTGTWLRKIGYLSLHPNIIQDLVSFEQLAQVTAQSRDGQHRRAKEIKAIHA